MKRRVLVVAMALAGTIGLACMPVIAGKGGGGGGGGGGGMGAPGMGGGSGLSRQMGAGGAMQPWGNSGPSTSGRGAKGAAGPGQDAGMEGYQKQTADPQARDRHRVGERDDVGVRTRDSEQAQ